MKAAFTLIELLVVIAILALLAAILFPVLGQVREKSRQGACLSNMRQLGMAVMLYAQDYDEYLPQGLQTSQGRRVLPGPGWGGQCYPYVRNTQIYSCPSDTTVASAKSGTVISYAYNINLAVQEQVQVAFDTGARQYQVEQVTTPPVPPMYPISLASLLQGSKTVLLFEVSGVCARVSLPREGDGSVKVGSNFSAAGNGLDRRLVAQTDFVTRVENQYDTGYLGKRVPPDENATQFASSQGRHQKGASYLLADGHARWINGDSVSSGWNALGPSCNQDNRPARAGCFGNFRAAGTNISAFAATFSIF